MKTNKIIIIAGLLAVIPILGFAQEWDDIYADPSQTPQQINKEKPQSPKKKIVVVEGDVSKLEVKSSSRDIDEYNRRGQETEEIVVPENEYEYQDYEYTDRIVKYHDPEAVIKITGADKITIYTDDELYSDYYDKRYRDPRWNCGCCYPWYDPWYDPWFYGWYSPWYYSGWRWNFYFSWYSPWYYGWHAPWYSPWYYGWYDPWFYGGWGYPYYWGYNGYYAGFYDGIYVGVTRNSSGRSTTTYRSSAAGRSTSAGLSGSRSSGATRSSTEISGRSSGRSSVATGSGRSSAAGSTTVLLIIPVGFMIHEPENRLKIEVLVVVQAVTQIQHDREVLLTRSNGNIYQRSSSDSGRSNSNSGTYESTFKK